MDAQKLVMGLVGLAVIIMVVTAAVLPTVENAQAEQKTIKQNSDALFTAIPSSETLVYSVTDNVLYINGQAVTDYIESGTTRVYVVSDAGIIRTSYTEGTGWGGAQFVSTLVGGNGIHTITATNTVEFNNGTVKVTTASDPITGSYSYVLSPSKDGKYGAWETTALPKFVDDKSKIYAFYAVSNTAYVASGTLDALTMDFYLNAGTPSDPIAVTATYTPTDNDASNSLTALSGATFRVIMAPLDYTVIDDTQNSYTVLLGLIPLLLIIVAVLYAVRLMGSSRN